MWQPVSQCSQGDVAHRKLAKEISPREFFGTPLHKLSNKPLASLPPMTSTLPSLFNLTGRASHGLLA